MHLFIKNISRSLQEYLETSNKDQHCTVHTKSRNEQ